MARYAHASDFAVVADCFSRAEIQSLLGVPCRTIDRWSSGQSRIPWSAYQLLLEHSKYGRTEDQVTNDFERQMILGERDALRDRVASLEAELIRISKLVDWGSANDPFVLPTDPRTIGNAY